MQKSWIRETLYDIRDEALANLLKAYDIVWLATEKLTKTSQFKNTKRRARQESIIINSKITIEEIRMFGFIKKIKTEKAVVSDNPL